MTDILERLNSEPGLRQMMMTIATRMVGRDDAEDVVQSVFMRTVRSAPKFRNEHVNSLGAYLKHAVIMRCIEWRRARSNWHKHFEYKTVNVWNDFGSESPNWDATIDMHKIRQRLDEYIGRLRNKQHAAVLTLRLYEGLPYQQIADELGMAESNCKTIFTRHKIRLAGIISYAIESTGMGRAAGRAKAAGIGRADSGEQKR